MKILTLMGIMAIFASLSTSLPASATQVVESEKIEGATLNTYTTGARLSVSIKGSQAEKMFQDLTSIYDSDDERLNFQYTETNKVFEGNDITILRGVNWVCAKSTPITNPLADEESQYSCESTVR